MVGERLAIAGAGPARSTGVQVVEPKLPYKHKPLTLVDIAAKRPDAINNLLTTLL